MKFCPICDHKLYPKEGGGFYCKNCTFVNDPHHQNKVMEAQELENDKILEKL